ncbi:MAG: CorA family divalent cation transporter [Candidatus Bathyarchaeota archaeon]|nr:CorA family divalent cation transporter [Candidatus Bathyarchaeota archaeon]
MDPQTDTSAQTRFSTTPSTLELLPKRWFCTGLEASGKTTRQEAETPAGFMEILNRSVITWVDYITDDPVKDLPVVAAQMGFSEAFIGNLSCCDQLNYSDFDTEMWLTFPAIQIRGNDVKAYPLIFLIRKNLVFTFHTRLVDKRFLRLRRYSETILRKIPTDFRPEDRLTILLSRILEANNDSNFRHLRAIEEFGDELNRDLMDRDVDKSTLGPKIYEMKHALIIYLNALWESVDVLQGIRYGDAELLTDDPKLVNLFAAMVEQVKSQIALSEHMSEVLASGIEATQAIYNNQLTIANNQLTISNNRLTLLNNRLSKIVAYLTIIGTAILIPNTIATMLGNSVWVLGPDFLPAYLALMFGATALGSILMWVWIKKSGLLNREHEHDADSKTHVQTL